MLHMPPQQIVAFEPPENPDAFQPGLNLLFGTRPFLSGKAREANAGVFMKFAPDQGFEPEAPAAVYRHDAHPGVVSNISR